MSPETLTTIVILGAGGIISAMAVIIKAMVSDKLKDLQVSITGVRNAQEGLREDIHVIDIRLTKLEVEHHVVG